MKKAYILLCDGFEEIEALSPADILRRAGCDVKLVNCNKAGNSGENLVRGAHNFYVKAELTAEEAFKTIVDAVILPGGMPGSKNLAENGNVKDYVVKMNSDEKLVAAICAAPAVALGSMGILKNRSFTCYPDMEELVPAEDNAHWLSERVVCDKNLITSRGPGTAGEFGFAIAAYLTGSDTAASLKNGMLYC